MEADFSQSFSHLTDVLGSLQMIKRYSVISLFFKEAENVSTSDTTNSLKDALHRLILAFPFLAGKVVYEGRDDTHTGIRQIVPHRDIIPLFVKNFTSAEDFPSMDEIASQGFPMTLLDPEKLVPSIAVTWATDDFDKYAPVLVLQANYVRGGLILTIAGNHSTMDMTGLGMIIALLSKACRKEDFTPTEIQQGNQDRRKAIPLLDESYQPGSELDDSLIKPPPPGAPPMSIPPAKWIYINFPSARLSELKATASNQSIVPYISTDDAISALLWQRISLARATLDPTAAISSQLCRTVSMRSFLGLQGYLGHMVDCVYSRQQNVHNLPFGDVAGQLRLLLRDGNDQKLVHHMRAYATALDRLADKTKIVNGAQLNPNTDVVVSSYANMKCCELDFGAGLGVPLAARRPRMAAWPSLLYVMPKDRDGDTAVAVCLTEEELEVLKGDEVLGQYVSFVG